MKRKNNLFIFPITTAKVLQILIISSCIVFFQVVFNGFVYDDIDQIVTNPAVHTLQAIPSFFTGSTFFDPVNGQTSGAFYRPIMSTFFAVIYSLFGAQASMYHLVQILFHTTNALLVYLFCENYFKKGISLGIACIFLIHPINQEVAAYISDFQEVLFFFFGMLGLLILSRSYEERNDVFWVPLCLLLSLFSKETGILFIPVGIGVLLLGHKAQKKKFYWGIGIASLIYGCIRFFGVKVSPLIDPVVPIMRANLEERLLTMPSVFWYYIKTVFFPLHLALGDHWVVTKPNDPQFIWPLIFSVLTVTGIIIAGILLRKKKTNYDTFILFAIWFFCGCILHSQLVPLDGTVADRWFYFSFVGLLGMVGVILESLEIRFTKHQRALIIVAITLIAVLSVRTMVRNTNWKDTYTLCLHDRKILHNAYSVESACGSEAFKRGNFTEAKEHYTRAAALAPAWGLIWYQLGLSNEQLHDLHNARNDYEKSISLSHDANSYVSLAAADIKYDHNPNHAKEIIEEGITFNPHYQRLQLYLAVCEQMLGNHEKALDIATHALQQLPSPEATYVVNQLSTNQEIKIE